MGTRIQWEVTFGLYHPHSSLRVKSLCSFSKLPPASPPAAGPKDRCWLAVAMGTSQGHPGAGTSHPVLFWATDAADPFTLRRLTAGLGGTLPRGGGVLLT